MKGPGLPVCLLSAVFYLCWKSSTGLRTLQLGRCAIATNLQEMRRGFSEIRDSVVREGDIPHPNNHVATSPLPYWSLSVPQSWDPRTGAGWGLLTRRNICGSPLSRDPAHRAIVRRG